MNRRSSVALYVFLAAMASVLIALAIGGKPDAWFIAGFFVLTSIIAWLTGLVLAVVGWVESVQQRDRHHWGKGMAIATLIGGAIFGLVCVVPVAVHTVRWAAAATPYRTAGADDSDLLKYNALNFVFHAPGPPWVQVNAKKFGPGPVLALTRRDPMSFTLTAIPLPPRLTNSRMRMIEFSMKNLQRSATSFQLIHEGEATHHQLTGWQIETEASIQGHEFYLVHWLVDTNGFGYMLVVWGPAGISEGVKKESDRMFDRFETTSQEQRKDAR